MNSALGRLSFQWEQYAYIDKAQEAKRRAATTSTDIQNDTANAKIHSAKRLSNLSWSGQVARKDARQVRKEKRVRKRKWLESKDQSTANANVTLKTTPDVKGVDEEWDELAREERMAKKVRRGDLSQEDFDKEFDNL
jgi:ATP-dependent RNA helicase DDX55/SPB4